MDQEVLRGELQIKIFNLRRRLDALGEESELVPRRDGASAIGEEVSALTREVSELEVALAQAEQPKHQRRRAAAEQLFPGRDHAHFLARRLLRRHTSIEGVEDQLQQLRACAGSFGDPSGRVFSEADVESAGSACLREMARRAAEESESENGDAAKGANAARGRPKGKGQRRARAAVGKQRPDRQATKAKAGFDDEGEAAENEEEEDLEAEQAIDLDGELDEHGVSGLVDTFAERVPFVGDAYGDVWRAVLPPGSWCIAEEGLAGRLQRRGLVMPEAVLGSSPEPGHPGFNSYCAARLRLARIGQAAVPDISGAEVCPPLQPHQDSVVFLLHPLSPIPRMLVNHPTGCGKTREMIQVLESRFSDPRPKVPIFPTEAVCRNFYVELLRWPSRYRDFFCCEETAMALQAAGLQQGDDWRRHRGARWSLVGLGEAQLRTLCARLRECLEMPGAYVRGKLRRGRRQEFRKAHPKEQFPGAPLRALGYTSAGGSNIKLDPATGTPLSSLFKVGFSEPWSNPYSRKIVVMDEVHNLVRGATQYSQQLQVLRSTLATADDCLLVGFTATPILSKPSEGRLLLDTIKGEANSGRSDEGFVSAFPFKPRSLFPVALPHGIQSSGNIDEVLLKQLCCPVVLQGDALLSYDLKSRDPDIQSRQLLAYCNMFCWGGAFHDGKAGCKADVMSNPSSLAPKLHAIAQDVAAPDIAHRTKALVLVSRRTGYTAMLELMKAAGAAAKPSFSVATLEQLAEFNSPANLRGDKYLVLVADATSCSEGVSFSAVRRQFLADVPNVRTFVQQCGRVSRMYGHSGLPFEEQTVTTCIYTATMPKWIRGDALSSWCFRVYGRRGAPGGDSERLAQQLRERLQEIAGIKSLPQLKDFLKMFFSNRSGGRVAATRCANLGDCDAKDFLEHIGLDKEASLLGPLYGSDAMHDHSGEGASSPLLEQRRRARLLPKALLALHAADGRLVCEVALSASETEDERAVRRLQLESEELAPAQRALQLCAVDRPVLAHLGEEGGGKSQRVCSKAPLAKASRTKKTSAISAASDSLQKVGALSVHPTTSPKGGGLLLRRRVCGKRASLGHYHGADAGAFAGLPGSKTAGDWRAVASPLRKRTRRNQ